MRALGKTGVKVSKVALGAMSFGGDSDEATAAQVWRAARDAGINFIDTADVYNEGRSEEIVGRLMRGERDDLVLATKAYFPTGKGPNARGTSRYHLVRAVASRCHVRWRDDRRRDPRHRAPCRDARRCAPDCARAADLVELGRRDRIGARAFGDRARDCRANGRGRASRTERAVLD